MSDILSFVQGLSLVQAGLLASLIAGAAAGLGALPIYIVHSASPRLQDVLLGVAAGLMLGATAFSLVLPGIDEATGQYGSRHAGVGVIGAGMLLGAVLLWIIHDRLPHEHFVKGLEAEHGSKVRRVWLFVIAITVHNFPEGLAVGVGFGGGDVANGLALTTAIFLQNLPEGFAVALALSTLKYRPTSAVLLALGTGVVETVGGFVGAGVVSLSVALLPWGLAVAAGAMLFVISHEVIPETHRNGHETPATFGVIVGFILMMFLDVAMT